MRDLSVVWFAKYVLELQAPLIENIITYVIEFFILGFVNIQLIFLII